MTRSTWAELSPAFLVDLWVVQVCEWFGLCLSLNAQDPFVAHWQPVVPKQLAARNLYSHHLNPPQSCCLEAQTDYFSIFSLQTQKLLSDSQHLLKSLKIICFGASRRTGSRPTKATELVASSAATRVKLIFPSVQNMEKVSIKKLQLRRHLLAHFSSRIFPEHPSILALRAVKNCHDSLVACGANESQLHCLGWRKLKQSTESNDACLKNTWVIYPYI